MQSSEFSALYQSSYPYIYQLVFSVNQDHQAVEDTVQEIYLAAWLRFRDSSHPNPFGWLVLTARHKACDMLRRRLREAKRCIPMDMHDDSNSGNYTLADAGTICGDISCLCEDASPYSNIRPLLRDEEFDLLLAHYEDGFSVNELAEKLHISPSACYMRLHRARRKLTALMATDETA